MLHGLARIRALGGLPAGLWMLINSLAGMAGALDFGFGDSTFRFVSMYRGHGDTTSIVRGIRTAYWVSIPIALLSGSVLFLCAPLLTNMVFKIPSQPSERSS